MPMSTLEHDTLSKIFALCKTVQADLQPKLSQLQAIYDSAGGVKETLTQAELDELSELSGLQKQTVDDGVFALNLPTHKCGGFRVPRRRGSRGSFRPRTASCIAPTPGAPELYLPTRFPRHLPKKDAGQFEVLTQR